LKSLGQLFSGRGHATPPANGKPKFSDLSLDAALDATQAHMTSSGSTDGK
jgi:hypothetical protein